MGATITEAFNYLNSLIEDLINKRCPNDIISELLIEECTKHSALFSHTIHICRQCQNALMQNSSWPLQIGDLREETAMLIQDHIFILMENIEKSLVNGFIVKILMLDGVERTFIDGDLPMSPYDGLAQPSQLMTVFKDWTTIDKILLSHQRI